jgi:hypothetical protein
MKTLLLASISCFIFLNNFGQVKMPAPSPTQTIKQDFAIGQIELTYSRPSAKGRKIFGELVPYNKLWRTGANAATLIKFSEPVEIKGKKIDTGSYVLYTIPNADSWEVILNKGLTNWGIDGYKESEDVVRFYAETQHPRDKVEMLTMQFDNIKPSSCNLSIVWEKTMITIPIECNIQEKLKTSIEAAMLTDKKPYWQAAQFYNEYEKNPAKALDYATKATTETPKAYWIWLYKAKIQYDMGDKAGAMESSKTSLDLATADKNDDYVRMNQALQKKLK